MLSVRRYFRHLCDVADWIILYNEIVWAVAIFFLSPDAFGPVGQRFFPVLGLRQFWIGLALVSVAAKVAKMLVKREAAEAILSWVSVGFWYFVTVLLFKLALFSPWWGMTLGVAMIALTNAIYLTVGRKRREPVLH